MAQAPTPVATVARLVGGGIIRHADGTQSALRVGAPLKLGDVVVTSPGGSANVQMPGGGSVDIGNAQGDAVTIDKAALDILSDPQDTKVSGTDVVNKVADIMKNGGDLNAQLEATAAGISVTDSSDRKSVV